jgi:hypothetical protein
MAQLPPNPPPETYDPPNSSEHPAPSATPPRATAAALTGPVTWWRRRIRKFCTAAINQLWIFCRHTPATGLSWPREGAIPGTDSIWGMRRSG